jgi:hypothetical protein
MFFWISDMCQFGRCLKGIRRSKGVHRLRGYEFRENDKLSRQEILITEVLHRWMDMFTGRLLAKALYQAATQYNKQLFVLSHPTCIHIVNEVTIAGTDVDGILFNRKNGFHTPPCFDLRCS